jgi:uncharacterized protein with NRDE domain|tara:strand:+ start:93 stop:284 length:192 start_codon:yes stop_codon:yes gene_type:complete
MAWVLVYIMTSNGMYTALSSPYLYNTYERCEKVAEGLKELLLSNRTQDTDKVTTFCLKLPKEA